MAAVNTELKVFDDVGALAVELVRRFTRAAGAAVRERGRFAVALSGGRTPEPVYRQLAANGTGAIPWSAIHLFWSDERFVAPDDEQSNYRMVRELLLSSVAISASNVHRLATELPDPDETARKYEEHLRAFFGSSEPRFDWVFLGLGEDGHVASLFPGSPALEENQRLVVAVRGAPKPPPVRLTMTLPLLNAAREVHFLVCGREKRSILTRVLAGPGGELPAQRIRPTEGRLCWWVDRLAYQ